MIDQTYMTTIRTFEEMPDGHHLVSIGTFDGVHLGHQHLLAQAKASALELGVPLLVVTFEPPPPKVIRPESFPGRLVTAERKLELLAQHGVATTLVLDFTPVLMRLTPEAFLSRLHAAALPKELWIGEDFALGHRRAGSVGRLTEIAAELGMEVHAIGRTEVDGEVVSSSRIRRLITSGEVGAARRLLGHHFQISGEVIEGAKIGRTIGYPTANVEPPADQVSLADGIYASLAALPGEPVERPAMTYIGTRPALNTGNRLVETHLLDFSGDLYGKVLAANILERIRPDATFASVEELVHQLKDDERRTRQFLAELNQGESQSIRAESAGSAARHAD